MSNFYQHIHSITNPDQLNELKESIKNQVVEPNLRWDERMILYKQVQLINERITELLQMKKEA